MDYWLEQLINSPAGTTPAVDGVMKVVAGGAEVLFLVLVAGWFLYGWFCNQRTHRAGAVAATVAAVCALGVNHVIALVWSRPRPFVAHPAVHVLLSRSTDPSFPSDHATAAFAIAAVVYTVNRRLGWAAFGLAALVAYARVYVGAHYPGDVLGGAVIGIGVGWLVVRFLSIIPSRLTDVVDELFRWLRVPTTR